MAIRDRGLGARAAGLARRATPPRSRGHRKTSPQPFQPAPAATVLAGKDAEARGHGDVKVMGLGEYERESSFVRQTDGARRRETPSRLGPRTARGAALPSSNAKTLPRFPSRPDRGEDQAAGGRASSPYGAPPGPRAGLRLWSSAGPIARHRGLRLVPDGAREVTGSAGVRRMPNDDQRQGGVVASDQPCVCRTREHVRRHDDGHQRLGGAPPSRQEKLQIGRALRSSVLDGRTTVIEQHDETRAILVSSSARGTKCSARGRPRSDGRHRYASVRAGRERLRARADRPRQGRHPRRGSRVSEVPARKRDRRSTAARPKQRRRPPQQSDGRHTSTRPACPRSGRQERRPEQERLSAGPTGRRLDKDDACPDVRASGPRTRNERLPAGPRRDGSRRQGRVPRRTGWPIGSEEERLSPTRRDGIRTTGRVPKATGRRIGSKKKVPAGLRQATRSRSSSSAVQDRQRRHQAESDDCDHVAKVLNDHRRDQDRGEGTRQRARRLQPGPSNRRRREEEVAVTRAGRRAALRRRARHETSDRHERQGRGAPEEPARRVKIPRRREPRRRGAVRRGRAPRRTPRRRRRSVRRSRAGRRSGTDLRRIGRGASADPCGPAIARTWRAEPRAARSARASRRARKRRFSTARG